MANQRINGAGILALFCGVAIGAMFGALNWLDFGGIGLRATDDLPMPSFISDIKSDVIPNGNRPVNRRSLFTHSDSNHFSSVASPTFHEDEKLEQSLSTMDKDMVGADMNSPDLPNES
eukprot:CAMPEP_0183772632 /NCGR_PEP_ID=MMETSP0739-20130205/36588_1 /TAXON_ID=385413 /ORGANISM="Thalassiosira miniscula, Strain CCMP1093" /LENGTH=117 /DNA_ID=CAMNT_0026013379 /DNA_START=99 /DNA_END=452 /DNA_ORIENTATION=+